MVDGKRGWRFICYPAMEPSERGIKSKKKADGPPPRAMSSAYFD